MFILSRISHLGERVGFLLSRAHQAGHSTPERQVRLIRRDPNEDARVPQTIHHAVAPPYFETEDKVQRASFLHAILMMFMNDTFWVLSETGVPFLRFVQLIALLTVVGAVAGIVAAVQSWRDTHGRRWSAAGRALTALACLVCAYVVLVFHFLTIELSY